MKTTNLTLLAGLIGAMFLISCERFLNEKPNQKLATPATVADLQALLNNHAYMNNRDAAAGEVSADNYYLTRADWQALSSDGYRRMYVWENDFIFSFYPNDWSNLYHVVYVSNTVLDRLADAEGEPESQRSDVRGQALFFRGSAFLRLAMLWCNDYDGHNPADMGIPLRLTPDFNETSRRAALDETYDRILADLREAAALLPRNSHPLRPSKAAAYGMLARAYLTMHRYGPASLYADSCLSIQDSLLDFNGLDASLAYPIPQGNAEVIFESIAPPPAPLSPRRARIDTMLYGSYEDGDLRKAVFFAENADGSHGFKGNFSGGAALFTGITAGEVYLIRAECRARLNDEVGALDDLNLLLGSRYRRDAFREYGPGNRPADLLGLVLRERRKELLMRGLRWADLKRLNKEGAAIEIRRSLDNEQYMLPPNDPRYALPIPEDVIEQAGIPQNPR
jgi:SusD family.